MQVIHDDEWGGIAMIPLIIDWHISKVCQVDSCVEKTAAIIVANEDDTKGNGTVTFGICETHYQEAKQTGRFDYRINFSQA